MSIALSYIMAPLIGGVIGYITNDIAIRMLFRPHKAKYLFGFHIPFTPGLIPKEKGRIAEAIGGVVSENLMNKEVLGKYLLSDEMICKVRSITIDFLNKQQNNTETVAQFLRHYLTEEELSGISHTINEGLSKQVQAKLTNAAIGNSVAHFSVEHVTAKLKSLSPIEVFASLGILKGSPLSGLASIEVIGKLLGLLRDPIESALARNINEMLRNNSESIVSQFIGNETDKFLDTPMKDLLKDKTEQLAQTVDTVENVYRHVITEHLPRILESIDISRIIRNRIEEMDVVETERLIMLVMNKELRAIVWLGALLGLILGSINALI